MPASIRPLAREDVDQVVDLSVRAWTPVFTSLREVLGAEMFERMHPGGWRTIQADAVRETCTDPGMTVWVAADGDAVVGFVAVVLHTDDREGEIHMIAVDPELQRRGIAARLTDHAVEWIAQQGMELAVVATGGDPGHAPARASYERSGFTALPLVRYYKLL